jgi:hypothetical protein
MKVLETRVLGITFGQNRDEMVAPWRKLHEEIHNLYSSPNWNNEIK